MSRNLRARLDRLERQAPADQTVGAWDRMLYMFGRPVAPFIRARIEAERIEAERIKHDAQRVRARAPSSIERIYHEELARLVMPEPNNLAELNLVEEILRLAAVPSGTYH